MFVTLQTALEFQAKGLGDDAENARNRARVAAGLEPDRKTRVSEKFERRTFQPVRRESRAAGREGTFWRPVARKDVERIILAAERFELSGKLAGRKNGPLGGVALEILRLFRNVVDFRTGRLDPSIDYLMAKLRRSRGAIVAALKALRTHGFLDWLRRYVPTGERGVRGPQVQQTSNAYRLSLPQRAKAMLGRYFQPAPVPDDHRQRQTEQAAQIEQHISSLSNADKARFLIDDPDLAASVARLGAMLDAKKERESTRQTESSI